MKYIYIAGLEHSGTTLTDHLLSQHDKCIGLGEIAAFFSSDHMQQYMERWGNNTDWNLCSCGKTWADCEFWSGIVGLCGLNSRATLVEKYEALLSHIRSSVGEDAVIIDSSKSLLTFRILIENLPKFGIRREDILLVFTIKDVRSFAASVGRKSNQSRSILSLLRTFNWWLGENREYLNAFEKDRVHFLVNLYERLCSDPESLSQNVARELNIRLAGDNDVRHNKSHIAMGNKNFVLRNRRRISYDFRWFTDDAISAAYLIHGRARAFNKRLYQLSQSTEELPVNR